VSVIVRTAKALSSRGGRLVLLSPRPNIADVLTRTQIDQIIPVFYDFAAARAAALAQS
jgi:anti-anti-sigma regulatory factor